MNSTYTLYKLLLHFKSLFIIKRIYIEDLSFSKLGYYVENSVMNIGSMSPTVYHVLCIKLHHASCCSCLENQTYDQQQEVIWT